MDGGFQGALRQRPDGSNTFVKSKRCGCLSLDFFSRVTGANTATECRGDGETTHANLYRRSARS